MLGNEAQSRILINQLLTNAGWRFNNGRDKELYFPANVIPEWDIKSPDGEKMYRADYALFDPHNYPICIVDANTPDNFSDSSQHYLHPSTIAANIQSFCKYTSNSNYSFKTKIPLPSLEEPEKIVAEIEGYQKVIDGCDMVIDNYKPTFKIDPSWEKVRLGEVIELQRGYDLPKSLLVNGEYPVIGSNGIIGYHNEFKCEGSGVITGRSGTIGKVHYSERQYWPHNTALFVKNFKGNHPKFIYFLLKSIDLKSLGALSVAVPTLDRKNSHRIEVYIPSIRNQLHTNNKKMRA